MLCLCFYCGMHWNSWVRYIWHDGLQMFLDDPPTFAVNSQCQRFNCTKGGPFWNSLVVLHAYQTVICDFLQFYANLLGVALALSYLRLEQKIRLTCSVMIDAFSVKAYNFPTLMFKQ